MSTTPSNPKPELPRRVLIANRGEIALRIARTARRLGIEVAGVFSTPDAGLPHLRLCHVARELQGDPKRVYLDPQRILESARQLKADAIHPGYGFLSENGEFSAMVEEAGIRFVGPTAEQARQLGDKIAGRKLARQAGVPTVPGTLEPIGNPGEAEACVRELGLPVIVKAAAGGGGRGMRVIEAETEIRSALERAQSEAQAAFGDGRVFIEKYFTSARHVEIQVLGDGKGQAVSLGERECSVQRRHQKLIEESPSPALTPKTALNMGACAAQLAASIHYRGACTLEFLVPRGTQDFFFIETNTRLQVEHPVTEWLTGLDLVEEQLRIACGAGFSFDPNALPKRGMAGAAIEARVIAEDPASNFRPSLGRLTTAMMPSGPGIRVDGWAEPGLEVSPHYDSLLAKVIAWGRNREEARLRLVGALRETLLAPIRTTAPYLADLLECDAFRKGEYDTRLVEEFDWTGGHNDVSRNQAILATAERQARQERSTLAGPVYQGRGLSDWQTAFDTQRKES